MLRKLIMYISAFLPMFLIMWTKEVLISIKNVIETSQEYDWSVVYCNLYLVGEFAFILGIACSLYYLLKQNRKVGVYTVGIKSIKNKSSEYYLAHYSVFILAVMEFSLVNLVDLIVLGLLLIVLGIVYIKNDLFFMNPTINIFQSYIYEVEYDNGHTTMQKIIISPVKLYEGNKIEIDISEFEFTFLRRKYEE